MTTILSLAADTGNYIHWADLGLDPVALDLGFFQVRWYSLAYLVGIVIGWWYLTRLVRQPGAPMARRHVDDIVFYVTIGIIAGGRLGYVLFYNPGHYFTHPLDIFRLWDGGMSFHGGFLGVLLAILFLCRRNKLSFLRVADYIACCEPFGQFFGRLANFVNGELWGRETDVPWAMVFPAGGDVPRHPSQLYEAFLEGIVIFSVLAYLFWRTRARWKPGLLTGVFVLGYGLTRFVVEFFRMPDEQLRAFAQATGLSMGQWLSLPMVLVGLYLIVTAKKRTAALALGPSGGEVAPQVEAGTPAEEPPAAESDTA